MPDIKDYYEILGLTVVASAEEVKQAYRDLIKIWHPDRFAHDPKLQIKTQEQLKKINDAYEQIIAYLNNRDKFKRAKDTSSSNKSNPEERATQKSCIRKGLNAAWCSKVFEGHVTRVESSALPYRVESLALTYDDKYIVSGSADQTLRVWDITTGKCLSKFNNDHQVNHLAISPNNMFIAIPGRVKMNLLALVAYTYSLKLIDRKTSQVLKEFGNIVNKHTAHISAITFTPDNRYLISGSWDSTIRIWDIDSTNCVKALECSSGIDSLTIDRKGLKLLSGHQDGTVMLWDLATSNCISSFKDKGSMKWDSIQSVAISSDGKYIVSGSQTSLRLWDTKTAKSLWKIDYGTKALTISPDDKYIIASVGSDIGIWELQTGSLVTILKGHTRKIWDLAMSKDGGFVISGGEDDTIRLWELDWQWECP